MVRPMASMEGYLTCMLFRVDDNTAAGNCLGVLIRDCIVETEFIVVNDSARGLVVNL